MIPTRDFCLNLHTTFNEGFYKLDAIVEGYTVEMYGYRFARDKDFKMYNAYELRGLTFVFDEATQKWVHFLALNKFFNLNQCEDWNYNDVKDKKIVRVQDKADGSLISFVRFPNGIIRAKSKMAFESEQAAMAQKLYDDNKNLQHFVIDMFNQDLMPIFELVSPFNQIVLQYNTTELLLLHIRNNKTGAYFTQTEIDALKDKYGFKKVEDFEIKSFDDYLELKKTTIGIEGWILTLEDGQMVKIKTDDYLTKHGAISEIREDMIIKLTLNEEIDDILAIATGEKKVFIETIVDKTLNKVNVLMKEYLELRNLYFNAFQEDRKKFAMEHKDKKMFGFVMRTINTSFRDIPETAKKAVKEYVLFNTQSLTKAKEFLE